MLFREIIVQLSIARNVLSFMKVPSGGGGEGEWEIEREKEKERERNIFLSSLPSCSGNKPW